MGKSAPLITAAELAATDPGTLLLVDCRFDLADPGLGHRQWRDGHLPGAVHASLDTDLSDLDQPAALGRHPLPSAAAFARSLGRWGWHEGLTVIAYDAGHGAMAAARLWWMLGWMGAAARVLDGGVAAWKAAGGALAPGDVAPAPTTPTVCFDTARVLYTDALRDAMARDAVTLVDARAGARYRGEHEPIDPRAGHVPGALNRPFTDNLDADGRWKPAATLRREWQALIGARAAATVVHMCGSGVTACHNLLAMEQAGLHGSRLYAPSWSGWSSDAACPVVTGPGAAEAC